MIFATVRLARNTAPRRVPSLKRVVSVVAVASFVVAACSGGTETTSGTSGDILVGIRASTDPAVGDDRLLFALNEIGGTRRGSPNERISLVARPLDDPSATIETDATFIWIIPGSTGLYRATVPFDSPGIWEIDFTVSTGEDTEPFLIDIRAEPQTVSIGEAAPVVDTPTLADHALEELTTDSEPLPALYESSLSELLTNGRKTVAIFATPAFCTSATCGPLLLQTKDIARKTPSVDFVHVEVYEGLNEPGFAPDEAHLAPAVVAFGLPSEPWIFVMDEDGTVISRFEGVLGEGELETTLETEES